MMLAGSTGSWKMELDLCFIGQTGPPTGTDSFRVSMFVDSVAGGRYSVDYTTIVRQVNSGNARPTPILRIIYGLKPGDKIWFWVAAKQNTADPIFYSANGCFEFKHN